MPVTLLGAEAGEVHVLERDEETRTVEIRQTDVPKGTRTDQVLTGEWFGLPSTLDPETLDLLDRHRELLRAGRPAGDPERDQIEAQLRLGLRTGTRSANLATARHQGPGAGADNFVSWHLDAVESARRAG